MIIKNQINHKLTAPMKRSIQNPFPILISIVIIFSSFLPWFRVSLYDNVAFGKGYEDQTGLFAIFTGLITLCLSILNYQNKQEKHKLIFLSVGSLQVISNYYMFSIRDSVEFRKEVFSLLGTLPEGEIGEMVKNISNQWLEDAQINIEYGVSIYFTFSVFMVIYALQIKKIEETKEDFLQKCDDFS